MVRPPAAKTRIAAPPPKPAAAFNRAAKPGLKPAFRQAAKPPAPVKTPPKVSPAIQAKQNFAKAAARPGAAPMNAKVQQIQKAQTRTKTK
jgi:hypothetical protein